MAIILPRLRRPRNRFTPGLPESPFLPSDFTKTRFTLKDSPMEAILEAGLELVAGLKVIMEAGLEAGLPEEGWVAILPEA